jgi:hypothetical protein
MFDKISPYPSLPKRGIQGNIPLWKGGMKGDFTTYITLFLAFVLVIPDYWACSFFGFCFTDYWLLFG